jgi:hypothetical protein
LQGGFVIQAGLSFKATAIKGSFIIFFYE